MTGEDTRKETSYEYGADYQAAMEQFYWEAQGDDPNHADKKRLALAERLVEKYTGKNASGVTVLDAGCSVGFIATNFSKKGYDTIGVDFDPAAIAKARSISERDGGSARFVAGDLSDASIDVPPVDVVLCFDIFEHLHDDELGSLFATLKRVMKPNGHIVFHTLPMQYDYLFWNRTLFFDRTAGKIRIPFFLMPFLYMSQSIFEKAVMVYSLLLDIALVLFTHKTYRERIKKIGHCNPLTVTRLRDIFERSGYTIDEMSTCFLTPQYNKLIEKALQRQPILHRSLYGVCSVRPK